MSVISIIIPCYKQAHFLPDALASVLAQTYQDWECIIVNDGSPDNTAAVAQEWVKKDSRFRYVEKPNGGLSSARNCGLLEVRGKFIQFLDADDAILPDKFSKQLQLLSEINGLAAVTSDYRFGRSDSLWQEAPEIPHRRVELDASGVLEDLSINWGSQLSVPCHCFLFDARIFLDHSIRFSEELPSYEDWDCWMQVFALPVKYRHLRECLAIYRYTNNSMSKQADSLCRGFFLSNARQMKLQPRAVRKLLKKKRKEGEVAFNCYPPRSWIRSMISRTPAGAFWRMAKRKFKTLISA